MSESEATVRFGEPLRSGKTLGIAPSRMVAIIVGVVAAVVAFLFVGGTVGAILGVVSLLAAAVVVLAPVGDRTPAEWAPIVASFLWGNVTGANRYRSTRPWRAVVTGEPADELERVRELPTGWDGPLSAIRLLAYRPEGAKEALGVLADSHRYRAILDVTGGHSMLMLDDSDQLARLDEWGDVLASCSRSGNPFSALQTLVILSADASLDWAAYRRDRAVLPLGMPVRDSLEATSDEVGPIQRRRRILVVGEIDSTTPAAAGLIRLHGGGDMAACKVLCQQLGGALRTALGDAGVTVRETLTERGVAEVLRTIMDPASAAGIAARHNAGMPAGVPPETAEPEAIDTGWDSLHIDANWIVTGYVAEYPQVQVHASAPSAIYLLPSCAYVVAQVLEPQPRAAVAREAKKAVVAAAGADAVREQWGFSWTPWAAKKRASVEEMAEAVAGGAAVYRHATYVMISAPTRLDAEGAWGEVEQAGVNSYLEVRRLMGQQGAGLAACLPLCRGV